MLFVTRSRDGKSIRIDWISSDDQNALTTAVSVDVSVYLRGYRISTVLLYHGTVYPGE